MSDEQLVELYLERAAIIEYDACLTRFEATKRCFEKISGWCKDQGRDVPEAIVKDWEAVRKNASVC